MIKRLTREGLRRLIVTEARKIRRLQESAGVSESELAETCAGAAGEAFKQHNPYDPDSDTQIMAGEGDEETGKELWDAQVEVAANRLTEELLDVMQPIVSKVSDDLVNGTFYDEALTMLGRGQGRRRHGARGNTPGEQGLGYER